MLKIKRPVLVACIGYIIGIYWGLCFNKSIIPIFLLAIFFMTAILILKKLNNTVYNYIKTFLRDKKITIILLIIFSILSCLQIQWINWEYANTYQDIPEMNLKGIIESNLEEKEYYYVCKLKDLKTGKRLILQIKKTEMEKEIKYGDIVILKGEFIKPSVQRNYGGFSYLEYLKTRRNLWNYKVYI